jgi:hypothetical protein
MKKERLLFTLLGAVIVLLSATAVAAFERDDVLQRVRYDVSAEREFEGAVVDRPRAFEGFMHFTLRTEDGLVVVQIGPKDFVQRSKFKPEPGQTVTVVGMSVVFADRQMVLAREIRKNGFVFAVRDCNGEPLWETDRPIQMDPKFGEDLDPVC